MTEVNAGLGVELRALRESCGLSGVAAAAGVGWSQSKLSRVETGRFGASLTEVADLLDFYGTPQEVRAELLARVARRDGPAGAWIVRSGGAKRRTASLGHVESRVSGMRQYAGLLVPGLLQSAEYSAALLAAGGWDSPQEVAAGRLARQERLLSRTDFALEVVLDARALMRSPGSEQVMADQFRHLAKLPPSVTLRVLPAGARGGVAVIGSFVIYDFGQTAPVVVLCESQTADLYLSSEEDVATYTQVMDKLAGECLSVEASRAYLGEVSRTLR